MASFRCCGRYLLHIRPFFFFLFWLFHSWVPGLGQITFGIVMIKKIRGHSGRKVAQKSRNSVLVGVTLQFEPNKLIVSFLSCHTCCVYLCARVHAIVTASTQFTPLPSLCTADLWLIPQRKKENHTKWTKKERINLVNPGNISFISRFCAIPSDCKIDVDKSYCKNDTVGSKNPIGAARASFKN